MSRRVRVFGVLFGLFLSWMPAAGRAADSGSYPAYHRPLDILLLGSGLAAVGLGQVLPTDGRPVPDEGFDPAAIHLGFDRRMVGNHSLDANTKSNQVRWVALAFPMILAAVDAPEGGRVAAPFRRGLAYAEALSIAEGLSAIAKSAASRPRPFTYQAAADRSDAAVFDAGADRAFQSMPSGHATISWCSASFGMTDHLLTRPGAGWMERGAVGLVGGFLATTTSALRVEAGQHFPSDVLAGAAIGTASGVAIPLLHRPVIDGRRAPLPSRRAWLETLGGVAVGVGAGLLAASAIGS